MIARGVPDWIDLITDARFQAVAVDGLMASIDRLVHAHQKQVFVLGFYRLSGRMLRAKAKYTEAFMVTLKTEPEIADFHLHNLEILQTSTQTKLAQCVISCSQTAIVYQSFTSLPSASYFLARACSQRWKLGSVS